MADEIKNEGTNVANEGGSTGTETSNTETTTGSEGTTTTTTEGTTTTTANEPEFKDENMQKAWTEKTQKLAEERKSWEAQVADFDKKKSDYEKKAALFDRFDSDPEVVAFIRKHYKADGEPTPSITQEEMLEATTDPAKFAELVQREAKKLVSPVANEVGNLKLENALVTYADSKGNEDFWELHDAGLIKDKMTALRNGNPRMSDIDLVKNAHLEARKIVNAIHAQAEKKAAEKAAGIVAEKKNASMDKGGRSANAGGSGNSFKGKTISEVGTHIMNSK